MRVRTVEDEGPSLSPAGIEQLLGAAQPSPMSYLGRLGNYVTGGVSIPKSLAGFSHSTLCLADADKVRLPVRSPTVLSGNFPIASGWG